MVLYNIKRFVVPPGIYRYKQLSQHLMLVVHMHTCDIYWWYANHSGFFLPIHEIMTGQCIKSFFSILNSLLINATIFLYFLLARYWKMSPVFDM